jgi:hypothetical protein
MSAVLVVGHKVDGPTHDAARVSHRRPDTEVPPSLVHVRVRHHRRSLSDVQEPIGETANGPGGEQERVDLVSCSDVVASPTEGHKDRSDHARPFDPYLVDDRPTDECHQGGHDVGKGCRQVGKVRRRQTASAEVVDRILHGRADEGQAAC